MIEDEILQGFLEKSASRAMDEIKKEGKLSEQNAIPLLLKAQFNHIAHLDQELSDIRKNMLTKDVFEGFQQSVDKRFSMFENILDHSHQSLNSKLNWFMALITLVVCIVLPVILEFLKKY